MKRESQHSGCTGKCGGRWNVSQICHFKRARTSAGRTHFQDEERILKLKALVWKRLRQKGSWNTCEVGRSLPRGWSVLPCCQVGISWKTRPSIWPSHCNWSGLISWEKQLLCVQPAPLMTVNKFGWVFIQSCWRELVKCLKWSCFISAHMSIEIRLLN